MLSSRFGAAFAATAVLAFSQLAAADFIQIQSMNTESTDSLCSFVGSISYTPTLGHLTEGTLVISLTNSTSPAGLGGFITGFAFNLDSADAGLALALESETHPFLQMSDVSAPPFGTFDQGAALGGHWAGGGSPSAGIAVGDTGTFMFRIDATDA